VEHVGLRPVVVQKCTDEGEVVLEACHAILLKNRVALAVPPGLTALQTGVLQRVAWNK
jgi:hypothetical protein